MIKKTLLIFISKVSFGNGAKMDIELIEGQIKKIYNQSATLIVGIDGLGGAGKSTVSEELYKSLEQQNYNIILFHIDDFIHPKAVRYDDNYSEWECYYNIQWRYDYLIDEIIMPIKNGMEFDTEVELYDKDKDSYFLSKITIPIGSIIIVEGVFLQREEFNGIFDYMIYIDIPEKIRLDRVLERDGYIGNKEQIKAKYDNRYFPAERYYVKTCSPNKNADYIIKE